MLKFYFFDILNIGNVATTTFKVGNGPATIKLKCQRDSAPISKLENGLTPFLTLANGAAPIQLKFKNGGAPNLKLGNGSAPNLKLPNGITYWVGIVQDRYMLIK